MLWWHPFRKLQSMGKRVAPAATLLFSHGYENTSWELVVLCLSTLNGILHVAGQMFVEWLSEWMKVSQNPNHAYLSDQMALLSGFSIFLCISPMWSSPLLVVTKDIAIMININLYGAKGVLLWSFWDIIFLLHENKI